MKRIALLIIFVVLSTITNAQWVQTNGPYGGTVTCLAINSNGNIFAGTPIGLFLSTDSGNNWVQLENLLTSNYASTIAINSSDVVFVGTGVTNELFRSTNNGNSWTLINDGLGGTVSTIAINSSGVIFVGTSSGGVYRSTNNGDNWTSASNGLTYSQVVCFAINSNGDLFAGTYNYVYGWSAMNRSTDNGDNWTQIGFPSNASFIAINKSNGYIFAGGYIWPGYKIYRSTDNGDNWAETGVGYGNPIYTLIVNSLGHVFASTGTGVYRSTNNGNTWLQTGMTSSNVVRFAINSSDHIYAGTSGNGIFLSTDNGSNWTKLGLRNSYVNSLVSNNYEDIFAGTWGDGAFRSTDAGNNWTQINTGGLENKYINAFTVKSNGYIFAGTLGAGVYLSINNGSNWTSVNNGLTDLYIYSLANGGDNIFAGTNSSGIFLSTDNGSNWTTVNNGLIVSGAIMSLIKSGDNIFAGTNGNGVFLSTDNGSSWTAVNYGLTNSNVYSLALSGDKIFAGTWGGGIFLSTNNGISWTEVNNGLSNPNIISISISGDNIFAGTWEGGIFISTNNGSDWIQASEGLTSYITRSLIINSVSGYIFLGTDGYGVWRRPLSEMIEPPITTTSTIIITHGYTAESIPNPIKENKARWKHYKWEFGMADQVTTDRQLLFIRKGQIYRYYGDYTLLQGIPDQAFIDDVIIQPEYGFSQTLDLNQDDEVVIVFDWAEESAVNMFGYAESAADALSAQLIKLATIYPWLLNNIQFIGHSRGTVVNSEAIERLLYFGSKNLLPAGILLDKDIHMTTLDPHPAGHWRGLWGLLVPMNDDAVNSKINGQKIGVAGWKAGDYKTSFIDNYYETNFNLLSNPFIGLDDFPGLNDTGIFSNSNLSDTLIDEYQPHGLIHTYYFGTVDIDAYNESFNEGSYINSAWYSNRDQQGFHFSETRLADLSDIVSIDSKLFDISSDKYFTKYKLIFNGDFSKANIFGNIPGWSYQGGNIDCDLGGFDTHGNPVDPYLILGDPGILASESHSITHNPVYISTQAKFIWFWMNIVTTSDTDILHVWVGDSEFTFSLSEPYNNWQSVTIPVTKKGTVQTIKFEITSAIQDLNADVHIDNVGFYVIPLLFDVQVSDNLEVIPIDNITEDDDENIIGENIQSNKYIIKLKDNSQNSEIKVIDHIDEDYSRYFNFEGLEINTSDQVILNLEDEAGVPTLNIYSSNSSSITEIIYPQIITKIGGTTILNNHEGKVEIVNNGSGQNICYLVPNDECIIKSVKVNSIDKGVLSKLLIDDLDKEELIEVVFQKNNINKLINTPVDFSLSQNFPNPFNPITQIHYAIPEKGFVSLKVFDILGKEVATLVSEEKEPGFYTVDFNGNDLSSGLYVYRIQAGNFIQSKKMILLK